MRTPFGTLQSDIFEFDSVLRDSGVAFGPSALLRAEFDKSVFEVSIQTPVTVRPDIFRRHIKKLSISETTAVEIIQESRESRFQE